MVEMLGVLAAIGILSIVGIYGYTMAMNKYKTNTLLDQLNRFSQSCSKQRQQYPNFNCSGILSEMNFNEEPYNWNFIANTNESAFSVIVPILPRAICQNIAQSGWKELIRMNQGTPTGTLITNAGSNCPKNTESEQSIVALTFADDPDKYTGGEAENPDEKPDEEKCTEGEIWYDGECIPFTICPQGKFKEANSGQCIPCDATGVYYASKYHCHQCPQRTRASNSAKCLLITAACKPDQFVAANRCYNCTTTLSYKTSQAECDKCGAQRKYDSDGYCRPNNICPPNTIEASGSYKSCDDASIYKITEAECNKCGDKRVYEKGSCIKNGSCAINEFSTTGGCKKCDDTSSYSSSQKECSKCGSLREYLSRSNYCYKKEDCPAGTFSDYNSGRPRGLNCDDPYTGYIYSSKKECDRCDDKRVYQPIDNICSLKPICTEGNFATGSSCTSCDKHGRYQTTLAECNKCGDKRFDKNDGWCYKKYNCPQGTDYGCKSCTDPRSVLCR